MSDQKTEVEIKRLAQETWDAMQIHECPDEPLRILDKLIRSLTPPQEPVDREALGKRIYACLSASESLEAAAQCVLQCRQASGLDDSRDFTLLDECRKKAIAARQDADKAMHKLGIGYYQIYGKNQNAALSIQKKEGVCVWKFSKNQYTSSCVDGRGVATQLSPAAMCWEFCPFCSNKIQEQGGGK